MQYELTTRHFQIFRDAVLKYVQELHVSGWHIEIHHEEASEEGDAMASVCTQLEGRRADFYLNKEWDEEPTDRRLDEKAKHEVAHLLCARLSGLASRRFTSAVELSEAEEELVMNVLAITEPKRRRSTKSKT